MNREYQKEMIFQLSRAGRPVAVKIGAVEQMETLDSLAWVATFSEYPDFRVLVPESEAGVDVSLMNAMVGQEVRVIVKGIDYESGIVACSRKEAVEKVCSTVMEQFQAGQIVNAVVVSVIYREQKPVLVVDIGQGVLCEVPRSKAAIKYTVPLREQYTPGQTVRLKVLSLDPVEFSVREAKEDPWQKASFKRRSLISGTVYRVTGGLIFVEPDLAPGILGLASVPLMGSVSRGMRVSCRVRSFDPSSKRLHLWLVSQL